MEPHLSPSSCFQLWEDKLGIKVLPSAHSWSPCLVPHIGVCSLHQSCHMLRPHCFWSPRLVLP